MKTSEYSMDSRPRGRRGFLKVLGIGLGGALAFGGIAGWWHYVLSPSEGSLFLFKRRPKVPAVLNKDSIFYPRDREVRRKISGSA